MSYSDQFVEAVEKIMSLEEAQKNELQSKAYGSLIDSFKIGNSMEYPDHFGGAYINEDQDLVICDCQSESKQSLYAQLCGLDVVKVEIVEYSYTYLNSVIGVINSYLLASDYSHDEVTQDVPEFRNKIKSVALDEKTNRVKVGIDSLSDKTKKYFEENIISSPAIEFIEEQNFDEDTAIGPGSRVTNSRNGGSSAAYRARRAGQPGIVICGHTVQSVGETFRGPGSSTIGTVGIFRYGGSVDAAWVRSNGNYNLTNVMQTISGTLSTQQTNPPQLALIFMCGQASNFDSGQIMSTNYTSVGQTGHPTLTNQSHATYVASLGDSGGIVCTAHDLIRVGIQSRRRSDLTGVYTKASVANNNLGLTNY